MRATGGQFLVSVFGACILTLHSMFHCFFTALKCFAHTQHHASLLQDDEITRTQSLWFFPPFSLYNGLYQLCCGSGGQAFQLVLPFLFPSVCPC